MIRSKLFAFAIAIIVLRGFAAGTARAALHMAPTPEILAELKLSAGKPAAGGHRNPAAARRGANIYIMVIRQRQSGTQAVQKGSIGLRGTSSHGSAHGTSLHQSGLSPGSGGGTVGAALNAATRLTGQSAGGGGGSPPASGQPLASLPHDVLSSLLDHHADLGGTGSISGLDALVNHILGGTVLLAGSQSAPEQTPSIYLSPLEAPRIASDGPVDVLLASGLALTDLSTRLTAFSAGYEGGSVSSLATLTSTLSVEQAEPPSASDVLVNPEPSSVLLWLGVLGSTAAMAIRKRRRRLVALEPAPPTP